MSSRRSDSDGTRTGTTARRWNRSSRNVPSAMSGGEIARTRRDDAHVDMDAGQRRRRAGNSARRERAGSCPAFRAACRRFRRDRACRHAPPRARRRLRPRRPCASTPNSSISIVSGAMVAALMTTKGPLARAEASWIERAASSLPEPGAPVIRTRELAGPTRSIIWRN